MKAKYYNRTWIIYIYNIGQALTSKDNVKRFVNVKRFFVFVEPHLSWLVSLLSIDWTLHPQFVPSTSCIYISLENNKLTPQLTVSSWRGDRVTGTKDFLASAHYQMEKLYIQFFCIRLQQGLFLRTSSTWA